MDAQGLPLAVCIGPANQRDEQMALPLIAALPTIKARNGQIRKLKILQGDAGYGFAWLIAAVLALLIRPLLALRGRTEHGSGLGKTRYVVERSLSWLNNYRRLRLCYEKTGPHFQAFHELAICHLLANRLTKVQQQF